MKIAAVADDLTGALDVAAAFADRGFTADVLLEEYAPTDADVTVVDTDSRDASPTEAAERTRAAAALLGPADILFKKIDSTLRGNWAAEIAALATGRTVLFQPANPAQGRTFDNGRVLVNGTAVDHPRVLQTLAGLNVRTSDCRSDGDLDALAAETAPGTLFVGSGGLAAALARRLGSEPAPRPRIASTVPPLVVAGSANGTTHRQIDTLIATHPNADILAAPHGTASARVVVADLADAALPKLAAGRPVILTGGETARAVLTRAGITRLRCLGHLLPGLPVSTAGFGGGILTLVSKAGGFGTDTALADAYGLLSPPQT